MSDRLRAIGPPDLGCSHDDHRFQHRKRMRASTTFRSTLTDGVLSVTHEPAGQPELADRGHAGRHRRRDGAGRHRPARARWCDSAAPDAASAPVPGISEEDHANPRPAARQATCSTRPTAPSARSWRCRSRWSRSCRAPRPASVYRWRWHADVVLASEKAFFMLAFTKIGLMPDGGASALIAAAIGRIRAMRMALLAERIPRRRRTTSGAW